MSSDTISKITDTYISYYTSIQARDCTYSSTTPDYYVLSRYKVKVQKTQNGRKNPSRKSQIAHHIQAGTPYTGDINSLVIHDGSASFSGPSCVPNKGPYKLIYKGYWLGEPNPSSLTVLSAIGPEALASEAAAKKAFVKKVNGVRQKVQGGVYIAEWRATILGIVAPFKGLQAAVRNYYNILKSRKRNFHSEKEAVKFLSATWLEYNFGFAPLLSDIQKGGQALADIQFKAANSVEPISVTGSVKNYTQYNSEQQLGGNTFLIKNSIISERSYSLVGAATSSISPPNSFARARELMGFTWNDFVPTIWEVIPFSFVVDYFSNVGDLINGAAFATDRVAWSCSTKKGTTYKSIESHFVKPYSGLQGSGDIGSAEMSKTSVSRSPLGNDVDNFIPPLTIQFPGLTQQANLIALADQFQQLTPYRPGKYWK